MRINLEWTALCKNADGALSHLIVDLLHYQYVNSISSIHLALQSTEEYSEGISCR